MSVPGTFSKRANEIEGLPGTFTAGFREETIHPAGLVTGLLDPSLVLRRFTMGACTILLAREPAGKNGDPLWHLSISARHRHPSWVEIKVARYRLLPLDLAFAMILPPPEFYVNVAAQDHVFHLWESTDPREPWSCG